jgi:predicted membrane channel-forming protein YqfA (hemolysin III family)
MLRRWLTLTSFWNVVTLIALLATHFRLDTVRLKHDTSVAILKYIDYLGIIMLIAGCALLYV